MTARSTRCCGDKRTGGESGQSAAGQLQKQAASLTPVTFLTALLVSLRVQQTSRAVIWDSIIREEKDALIKQSVDNEYTINDQSGKLRGRDVRLTLHYDVMPIVGLLRIGRLTHTRENDETGCRVRWPQMRRNSGGDGFAQSQQSSHSASLHFALLCSVVILTRQARMCAHNPSECLQPIFERR